MNYDVAKEHHLVLALSKSRVCISGQLFNTAESNLLLLGLLYTREEEL